MLIHHRGKGSQTASNTTSQHNTLHRDSVGGIMQSILWDLNKRVNRVAWPDGNEATVAVFRAERHWPPKRACTYRGTPATPKAQRQAPAGNATPNRNPEPTKIWERQPEYGQSATVQKIQPSARIPANAVCLIIQRTTRLSYYLMLSEK